ncbi:hypothetical protein HN371_12955 [Candidatus Poribacteria bacterium]|jgi:hypothetical protein|nr:hypothetical protein [Candidatus Poribacteria bacterium]MBT5533896.1 hypothetical protein [Candidatus Poribacteria bacterium]MBT5713943.1 hypothetical protein [Candidatus Poribacteria bacterium]MBT7097394.1 hypothetical protein [Candidatus Poribacteria bacterium]MBT7804595.1 hypothetical protein [Candidatus Poribacteria bacterium]
MCRRSRYTVALGLAVGCALLLAGELLDAHACPMCREAVTQSASDAGDAAGPAGRGLGSAFAWSIYIMIGVPYLMVSIAAFTIWRAVRRAQSTSGQGRRPEGTTRATVAGGSA